MAKSSKAKKLDRKKLAALRERLDEISTAIDEVIDQVDDLAGAEGGSTSFDVGDVAGVE